MPQDFNVNLDTEKIDFINIAVKLEKRKNHNEQEKLPSLTKKTIKREIGLVYLLIVVSIYLRFSYLSKIIPPKLLTCYNWAFFGITCNALIYYQLKRKGQNEPIKKEDIEVVWADYFFYGVTSLAVISLIYLTFLILLNKNHFLNIFSG